VKNQQASLDKLKKEMIEIHNKKMSDCKNISISRNYLVLDNFWTVLSRFHTSIEDQECLKKIIQKLSENINPKERTLLNLYSELIFTEGVIFNFIDYCCYLLVLEGHDLYDVVRRCYAKDVEDVTKVSMNFKLNFLNHLGYNVAKYYDLKFRNDVAHHNFVIDGNGHVLVDNKEVNILPRIKKIHRLLGVIDDFVEAISNQE
jgi:hypothetical protein